MNETKGEPAKYKETNVSIVQMFLMIFIDNDKPLTLFRLSVWVIW